MRTLDRRKFLTVSAGVGLAVVAAACSSGTAADTEGGTRTVTHKKGATEVPDNPQRIVTVGYSDQDTLLAFGRQPVGVTDWYGDYPDATWPWAQDALGGTHPEVFNRGQFTGEANFAYEAIAELAPDLILALYIDVDDDAYQRLSAIAPTVTTSPDYPDFGMRGRTPSGSSASPSARTRRRTNSSPTSTTWWRSNAPPTPNSRARRSRSPNWATPARSTSAPQTTRVHA